MHGGLTFSLSSLMLVVVCAAIASSLAAVAPALGIAFAVLASVAVARTAMLLRREGNQPECSSVRIKLSTFFESMVILGYVTIVCGVVTTICGAAGFFLGTFICTAFTSNEFTQWEAGSLSGMIVGLAGGLIVFALFVRAYWSRRQF
jgi:hypothetical protein